MITIAHTVQVCGPVEPGGQPRVDMGELWENLLHKAEDPVAYVPSITDAEVLERYPDGSFMRRIELREAFRVREHVTPESTSRIVFHQLDNPDLTSIRNDIEQLSDGTINFTLTATLSASCVQKTQHESGWLVANDLLFYDTARATVASALLSLPRTRAAA